MKLISWNVNGIRACLKKGFLDFVKEESPDVICIQESKAHKHQVDLNIPGYSAHWNSADKKGYSGTVTFTKEQPIKVIKDMGIEEHDKEGRVIATEFENFQLVNVYTPNAKRGLLRLPYRQKWDADFRKYVKRLDKKKPAIICGDLNVAHKEIDLKNPKSNRKNPGFTDEEREGFSKLLDSGFLDTFRMFDDGPNNYTWWSYMFNARAKNVGWRIDYFLASEQVRRQVKEAKILPHIMGSDHCPVVLKLKKF